MTEDFLHYIWQYRLFDNTNLKSDDGHRIEIVKTGQLNSDAGPDFYNAQIRIDGVLWSGNVEIHIHSSHWQRHNHHNDPSYDSCILHVVFENDATTLRMDGSHIPTIEIKNRFRNHLWENYLLLIGTKGWIPCESRIHEVDKNIFEKLHEKMIKERLEEKVSQIFISLKALKDDWEECFYQYLARSFGFRLNAMPFEMLARSLPLRCIRKEGELLLNIESMLFGQAGMLDFDASDEYEALLQLNYNHLAKKYSLKNIPHSSWKYLRLRPGNFPAVRIAQFASVLFNNNYLFRSLLACDSINDLTRMFKTGTSDYWNNHYHFRKTSPGQMKQMGASSVSGIIINTCIPFLYAWGKFNGDKAVCEKTIHFLRDIPAEENNIIKNWTALVVKPINAYESQSLINLNRQYCSEKRCLQCNIGNSLINTLP